MFIAAMHNGISRLYETFGNDGADTVERILDPSDYARTWYKPNPPLPKVLWSQRNNNNYTQTGLLTALDYFAHNGQKYLNNFWLKSKHSIEKPQLAGPAAYVLPADDTHPGAQAELLRVLGKQHVELSRADATFGAQVAAPVDAKPAKGTQPTEPPQIKTVSRNFPAGSWIVRMDQPYSRIADTLLDRQYWAPDDPQKHPYDDTGWSMGDLFGTTVVRVVDPAVLKVPMRHADAPAQPAFSAAGLGVNGKLPRIAIMHTWLDTQTEGWWRMALDKLGVKYDYISTQTVAREKNLRGKYDAILFGPIGGTSAQDIVDGLPMYGNALPWQKTALTPNLGRIDSTPDIRPGLGQEGLANLKRFVADGGLLIASEDTAKFAIDAGLAPGVSVTPHDNVRVVGSVLRAEVVDKNNPVARGYDASFAMYSAHGLSFEVSNLIGGDKNLPRADKFSRPTGRGGPHDADIPEGRPYAAPPPLPEAKPWQALPLNAEQERNNPLVIPATDRPEVIVRWADANELLVSGLLEHGEAMAQRAAVVQAHYGRGRVLLFASNPLWRGETIGSYVLVLNALTAAAK